MGGGRDYGLEATSPADDDYASLNLSLGDAFCDKSAVRRLAGRVLPPLYGLVFAAGALGNGLVLLALGAGRRGRAPTATALLLRHLAAADLLFLLTLPFWAAAAGGGAAAPTPACRALGGAYRANLCGGALLLAGLGVERYLAVARARRGPGGRRRRLRRCRAASAGVWLAAALLGLPELLLSRAAPAGPGPAACTLAFPRAAGARLKAALLALQAALGFLLPAAVMAACYALVIRALLRARPSPARRRALRLAAAVLAAFVLTQLPYNGVLLLRAARAARATAHAGAPARARCAAAVRLDVALTLTQTLAFLHGCLNPALHAFAGRRFRRDLAAALARLRGRRPARRPAARPRGSLRPPSTQLETASGASL
ncbi:C-C chemokine receptor type 9 [Perognathus longimembris pacificus]|uniref:C-C chemokine receptor type 9 n=1 Tax=Perognathus longimembris pacificus TaxID=214514 RepID=UPI00201A1E68|nr:C-C chemokine receptor type 9 [Perognathus longimembris pacificus]